MWKVNGFGIESPLRRNGLRYIQKARPMAGLFSYRFVIAPFPHETLLRKVPRGPNESVTTACRYAAPCPLRDKSIVSVFVVFCQAV